MNIYLRPLSFFLGCIALVACQEDQVTFPDPDDIKPESRICSTTEDFFTQNVLPTIAACSGCHFDHNASTELKIVNGEQYDNFLNMKHYIELGFEQTLLDKPTGDNGVTHQGGVRFDVTSQEYSDLSEFIDLVNSNVDEVGDCANLEKSVSVDVNIESYRQTLRKSALLFAGRLPTTSEYEKVVNRSTFRKVVKENFMRSENFDKFLMESANDKLLTNKERGQNSVQLNEYPYRDFLLNEELTVDFTQDEINKIDDYIYDSIKQTPLRLITYVVNNDLPYSEILTADYIVVNGYSGPAFMGEDFKGERYKFDNWQKGQITKYKYILDEFAESTFMLDDKRVARMPDSTKRLPQAGMLSLPMFLYRYQSTDTGRNRARANQTLQMFLGVDLEGSITRAQDPEELTTFTNPGDPTSSCFGCHEVLDPIAGAFQSYGDEGEYLHKENGTTALSNSYIRDGNRWSNRDNPLRYFEGDTWYRDNLIPAGFYDKPINEDEEFSYKPLQKQDEFVDALQWLADEIVSDEKFLTGTVKFWYPAIFGNEPINAPVNPNDLDYQERSEIYEYQQDLIQDLARDFKFRKMNLKDLLVDMVLSDQYRALDRKDINTNTELVAGQGVLLTPEQLDRKINAITLHYWNDMRTTDSSHKLLNDYYYYYGGIDSNEIIKRTKEMNSLMSLVIQRMSGEFACSMLMNEFVLPKSQRRLFVSVDDLSSVPQAPPENAQGVYKVDLDNIRHQIATLHFDILGEQLEDTDPEVLQTLDLFVQVWSMRINDENFSDRPTQNSEDADYNETCILDSTRTWDQNAWPYYNPEQTLKAWQAVVVYLMSDFKFIYR